MALGYCSHSTTPLLSPPTAALKSASTLLLPMASATCKTAPSLTSLNALASTTWSPADPIHRLTTTTRTPTHSISSFPTLTTHSAPLKPCHLLQRGLWHHRCLRQQPVAELEQVVSNNSTAQGRDTTPPTPNNGNTSTSGSSISINFSEPLDNSNLQNLKSSNTLSIYVDGQKLDSADISYVASPASHISDPNLL